MSSEFEKLVFVSPAFDKRSDDPSKDYGISACQITFILKGPLGAVQFMIGTDWHLPDVQRERRQWQYNFDQQYDKIHPQGWDVGYHSPRPMYCDHKPMKNCYVLETCYYDGSSLLAEDWVPQFIAGGTEWLWPALQQEYQRHFVERKT